MIEDIASEARKLTKDFEVYFQNSEINEIQLQKNKINFLNKVFDSGYGIRVLNGGIGFSSSSDKSKDAVIKTILNSLKAGKMAQKAEFYFPEQGKYEKVETVDKKIKEDGEKAVFEKAEEIIIA